MFDICRCYRKGRTCPLSQLEEGVVVADLDFVAEPLSVEELLPGEEGEEALVDSVVAEVEGILPIINLTTELFFAVNLISL